LYRIDGYNPITMDFSTQLRKTYLGAAPHTLFTGLVWVASGFLAENLSKHQAIAFFIIAGTFVFPGGELVRKLLKAPNVMAKENKLPLLFMLLAFTIPLSYPLIYMACKTNVNFFFPAFSILVGAHYLPFIYGYGMKTFGIVAALLITNGILNGIIYPTDFSTSGYITGSILIAFAFIHFIKIKYFEYEQ